MPRTPSRRDLLILDYINLTRYEFLAKHGLKTDIDLERAFPFSLALGTILSEIIDKAKEEPKTSLLTQLDQMALEYTGAITSEEFNRKYPNYPKSLVPFLRAHGHELHRLRAAGVPCGGAASLPAPPPGHTLQGDWRTEVADVLNKAADQIRFKVGTIPPKCET